MFLMAMGGTESGCLSAEAIIHSKLGLTHLTPSSLVLRLSLTVALRVTRKRIP